MLHPSYPIETPRLRLRPETMDDLDWMYGLRQIPEVIEYLPFGAESRDELKDIMEKRSQWTNWTEDGDRIMLIAEKKESGEVIGEVGLFHKAGLKDTAEVGYILHPDHQGKGYATEMSDEMLRMGFEDAKLHRIVANCNAENTGSLAVMLKLGMRQEGIAKSASFDRGKWRDLLTCAILEDEWRAQQG